MQRTFLAEWSCLSATAESESFSSAVYIDQQLRIAFIVTCVGVQYLSSYNCSKSIRLNDVGDYMCSAFMQWINSVCRAWKFSSSIFFLFTEFYVQQRIESMLFKCGRDGFINLPQLFIPRIAVIQGRRHIWCSVVIYCYVWILRYFLINQ